MHPIFKYVLFSMSALCISVGAQELVGLACTGESETTTDVVKHSSEKVSATIELDLKNEKIKIQGITCKTQSSTLFRLYGTNINRQEEDRLSCNGWLNADFDENNISFFLESKPGQSNFPTKLFFILSRVFGEVKLTQSTWCENKSCMWVNSIETTKLNCRKLVRQF